MTRQWPSFITKDLGESADDAAEMLRRWMVYDREMKALIARGGVHQDADGWWVETATGTLIGPDPSIERPLTSDEVASAVSLSALRAADHPMWKRPHGNAADDPEEAITLRLPRSVLQRWQQDPDWREKMVELLEKAG
ncbi:hypothetical protein [Rhizobium sp. SG2393]|uniref:hypothetical protein n=1 Tax=Rhizobium sp. SG2393 TaxID=3276279 RepID=UPI003670EF7B